MSEDYNPQIRIHRMRSVADSLESQRELDKAITEALDGQKCDPETEAFLRLGFSGAREAVVRQLRESAGVREASLKRPIRG